MDQSVGTTEERERIEETLRHFFAETGEGVAAVYLFGTAARGELRESSDVDVAVLFVEDPPPTLRGLHLGWAQDLSEIFGRPMDLVVLNFAVLDARSRTRSSPSSRSSRPSDGPARSTTTSAGSVVRWP